MSALLTEMSAPPSSMCASNASNARIVSMNMPGSGSKPMRTLLAAA